MTTFERLRRAKGLTQAEVADHFGIDQSAVSKWETGETLPRSDRLSALAKLYGCKVNAFFSEEDTSAGANTLCAAQ